MADPASLTPARAVCSPDGVLNDARGATMAV